MRTPCPLRYSPLMPLPGRQVAIPVTRHLLAEINDAVKMLVLCRILVLLERLTSQLPIVGTRFSYVRTAFAVAGEEVDMTGFTGATVGVDFSQTNVITLDGERSTTLSLPADILNNVMTNGTLRLTYASFRNGNLFNTSETSETLGGTVIAAQVVDQTVENLENPLTITFTKSQVSSRSSPCMLLWMCPSLVIVSCLVFQR